MKKTAFLCRDEVCRHDPECREIPDFSTPPHGVFVECPWCGEVQMIQQAVDDYVVETGTTKLVGWMWKCHYYDRSRGGYPCQKPLVYTVVDGKVKNLAAFLHDNPGTELYVDTQRKNEK